MKILYVTTISNTVNAFLIPHIRLLIQQGHQVDVAFNIVQKVDSEIIELGCEIHELGFQRSPIKKQNYIAYKKLKKLIQNGKYDLVHTHTPIASACVRLACRKMKNVKVIYTAHGFHFYKGAPLKNWLIYYPIEYYLSRYTDVLITINYEDYERAKGSFKARKIEYVPGVGLDNKRFNNYEVNKMEKRRELGVPKDAFIIFSIGELNKNKNHQVIIKAIEKLGDSNVYYVLCGQGSLDTYLRELSRKLGIEKQIKLLGFRKDIVELCNVADVFVFPSLREGLSVSLMEAMASGLPIICSDIRGNSDLVVNRQGGYLVEPNNIDGFSLALEKLIKSEKTRQEFGEFNLKRIQEYSVNKVMKKMKEIYQDV